MGKTSIKVILAGRNYPLTINEGEEQIVREAVDGINSSIKRLQENYAVKDMQDLLAMTALQLATRPGKTESSGNEGNDVNEELLNELKRLSDSITF
ncbi:MAG: cell division protein ZapA [Brumimicrobium sp.]|nr:cell division protein ZapA [Brumimicrobium sp.]